MYGLTAIGMVRIERDDHFIEFDPNGSSTEALDFQAWVGEGNTPAPYVPPTPSVPDSVEMAQARLALLEAGLYGQVQGAIAAMTGPEGDAARIEWEFRQRVRRDSPLVQSLIAGFGWSDQMVDGLFILAATK